MDVIMPKPVNEIITLLNDVEHEGYLVGSTVRKMVMGDKPEKYFICTDAEIDNIKKAFKNYNTYITGNNRTLVILNNKFPMEINNYDTIENDLESYLAEQDFTMNALAYSEEDGLVDYNTGVQDINNKVLRLNGLDDDSFVIDPLRILRAIRLSGEYGMKIDSETVEYMFDDKEMLKDVAPERIREELCKILLVEKCPFYIKRYLDIFLVVIPELTLMENFMQNNPDHIYDVLEHTLVTLKNSESNLYLRLALLLHDIGKPLTYVQDSKGIGRFPNHEKKSSEMAREIMNRLKFSKKEIQLVTKVIDNHDTEYPEQENLLKQFISNFTPEELELLYKVKKANIQGKNPGCMSQLSKLEKDHARVNALLKRRTCLKRNELKITGRDLLEIGYKQENIGKILDKIYIEVLNDNLKNHKDQLISYSSKML